MRGSELGSYLRLLRIKNNLTMSQTSNKTGITQGYISQIENGIYSPSAKTLARLARTYKIPEIHLLRKAGIVQSDTGTDTGITAAMASDPLIEISSTDEMMEMIKRGLSSLEYLGDQLRLRGQLANMPTAVSAETFRTDLSVDMLLPMYDAGWHPLMNASGEQAGMQLPAYMCNDDPDAFILVAADGAMAPLIQHGDWVIISPATEPVSGQIAAINDRSLLQLRIFTNSNGIVSLMPMNKDHTARGLLVDTRTEKIEIIGRVLRIVNRIL